MKTAWKRRWLRLESSGLLVYYKKPEDVEQEKSAGRIDLRGCEIKDNLGQG